MIGHQAPGQAQHWPPKPIDPAAISPDDVAALDVRLDTMARSLASDLDFNLAQRAKENLETTGDTFLIAPQSWPTHKVIQNWITCLQQARALLGNTWQPMDTAPRNSTVILLSHAFGVSLVRWNGAARWWQVMVDEVTPALERGPAGDIRHPLIVNTPGLRWMHRPARAIV